MSIPATTSDTIRHALNRWTYGPTTALLSAVQTSGIGAYLDRQFTTWRDPDAGASAATSGFLTLGLSSADLWAKYSTGNFWAPVRELQAATLLRAVGAEHQLYERMVEFWSDHFNIDVTADVQWVLKPVDDSTVIRKHALGRFEDMLLASAQSPAMLVYLDQWKSTGAKPNENYGREVLELHTLGVDGGYTEDDVKETARLLTGWSVNFSTFTFQYFDWAHDARPAKVLGVTYGASASGYADGISLLRALARHPSTARNLAKKLCRRFVSDNPSAALIESVASAYLASGTDIAATLRALFNSAEFWASTAAKTRRPIDVGVAFLRATSAKFALTSSDPTISDGLKRIFVAHFDLMSQGPFRWPTPDGYPDSTAAWLHPAGLLSRWNFLLWVAQGYVYGVTPNMTALLGSPKPTTAGALVDRLANAILFRAPTTAERDACLAYLGTAASVVVNPLAYDLRARHLIALLASTPSFQTR